jgi:hypothetical protein
MMSATINLVGPLALGKLFPQYLLTDRFSQPFQYGVVKPLDLFEIAEMSTPFEDDELSEVSLIFGEAFGGVEEHVILASHHNETIGAQFSAIKAPDDLKEVPV